MPATSRCAGAIDPNAERPTRESASIASRSPSATEVWLRCVSRSASATIASPQALLVWLAPRAALTARRAAGSLRMNWPCSRRARERDCAIRLVLSVLSGVGSRVTGALETTGVFGLSGGVLAGSGVVSGTAAARSASRIASEGYLSEALAQPPSNALAKRNGANCKDFASVMPCHIARLWQRASGRKLAAIWR